MDCQYYRNNKVCCDEPKIGMCTAPDCVPKDTYQHAQDCQNDRQKCPLSNRPMILILGADGYLGWPAAMKFSAAGWKVVGVDAGHRRRWVEEVGGHSLTPILSYEARAEVWWKQAGQLVDLHSFDVSHYVPLADCIAKVRPDTILHLAEQPSAAFSMIDVYHAVDTQERNVRGNLNVLWAMTKFCPTAHLIKLGTMGEYGTPDFDIPEGHGEYEFRGRKARVAAPKAPGSFYHASKVFDTINLECACKWWGLTATDIMQGPVYGIWTEEMAEDERLLTRLDYDESFGTVINRFVTQAVAGHGLTVYGEGGQTRGYLTIGDSMAAMHTLAMQPPEAGEYRVVNQFVDFYSVLELAEAVRQAASELGLDAVNLTVENPRVELEQHYYNPDCEILPSLGWQGTPLEEGIAPFLESVLPYKDRIKPGVFMPHTSWRRA